MEDKVDEYIVYVLRRIQGDESPHYEPGIEPINEEDMPEVDDDEEFGLFPVIQNISSNYPVDQAPADQIDMEDEVTPINYLDIGTWDTTTTTPSLVGDEFRGPSQSTAGTSAEFYGRSGHSTSEEELVFYFQGTGFKQFKQLIVKDALGKVYCQICHVGFKIPDNLRRHLMRLHPEFEDPQYYKDRYKCGACSYESWTIYEMVKHIKAAHDPSGKFQCKYCSCRYKIPGDLSQHITSVHADKATPVPYRIVIVRAVGGQTGRKYECTTCDYCTLDKPTIRLHIEDHKPKEKYLHPNNGEEIIDAIGQVQQLETLPRTAISFTVNGNKMYKCTKCDVFYAYDIQAVNHHVKTVHNFAAVFTCKTCQCRFKSPDNLDQHIAKYHSTDSEAETEAVEEDIGAGGSAISENTYNNKTVRAKGVKMFQCKKCTYVTIGQYLLAKHVKVAHGPNGKFQCKLCPCRYVNYWHLEQHMRLHHSTETASKILQPIEAVVPGEIPVKKTQRKKCPLPGCLLSVGNTVMESYEMKQHLNICHNPKAEFTCEFCPCRYLTSKGLKKHITGLHNGRTSISLFDGNLKPKQEVLEKQKKCPVLGCPKILTTDEMESYEMKMHFKVCHNPKAELTCKFCPCRYLTSAGLKRHVTVFHTGKNLTKSLIDSNLKPKEESGKKCPVPGCPVAVLNTKMESFVMKQHMKRCHSPESQFKCKYCPCRYKTSQGLCKHMTSFHENNPISLIDNNSKMKEKKKSRQGNIVFKSIQKVKCIKKNPMTVVGITRSPKRKNKMHASEGIDLSKSSGELIEVIDISDSDEEEVTNSNDTKSPKKLKCLFSY